MSTVTVLPSFPPSKNRTSRVCFVVAAVLLVMAGLLHVASSAVAGTVSVLASKASDRSNATSLDGSVVSGDIYVFGSDNSAATSVSFWLDNPAMTGSAKHVESSAPYDFAGGTVSAAHAYSTTSLSDGAHSISVKYAYPDGSTASATAYFQVANTTTPSTPSSSPPPASTTGSVSVLSSTSSSRSAATPLGGSTVSGSTYVFGSDNSAVSSVSFWIDNTAMSGTPYHVEKTAPYDLVGGTSTTAQPFDTTTLSNGTHTVSMKYAYTSGATASASASFTVANGASTPPSPTPSPSTSPSTVPTPSPSPTATTPAGGPCGWAATAPPTTYKHVIWIWMENNSYGKIIGAPGSTAAANAPYVNALAGQCGLATNYHSIWHPSLPNYLAAVSGDRNGVASDCSPSTCPQNLPSIFGQLQAAGKSWRGYDESMSGNCNHGAAGNYAAKHNPAVYYSDASSMCSQWDIPLGTTTSGALISDLNNGTLPNFSFVTPDLCDDMHSCSITTGDNWLKTWMPLITNSPSYKSGDTAVFLTWDEGSTSLVDDCALNTTDQGCHVATIVVSPYTVAHTVSGTLFNHYALLRTTEDMLGLTAHLGHAADSTSVSMRPDFHL